MTTSKHNIHFKKDKLFIHEGEFFVVVPRFGSLLSVQVFFLLVYQITSDQGWGLGLQMTHFWPTHRHMSAWVLGHLWDSSWLPQNPAGQGSIGPPNSGRVRSRTPGQGSPRLRVGGGDPPLHSLTGETRCPNPHPLHTRRGSLGASWTPSQVVEGGPSPGS